MRRILLLLVASLFLCGAAVGAEEPQPKWSGVDETVVEKYARDLGREAREPYINTDQGDLLLFLFALSGSVGGFLMGYFWHKVFVAGKVERRPDHDDRGSVA